MFDVKPRNPIEEKIQACRVAFMDVRQKLNELYQQLPPEEVQDYEVTALDGSKVKLSSLFGDNDEMILIHYMGPSCAYCTLWADGFSGHLPYYQTRCAFLLESDIPANELAAFKEKRGWKFNAVSTEGTSLKTDLHFKGESGNHPGVSTLYLKDGKIFRHAMAPFGPGDDYCPPWQFFAMLKKGVKDWEPKYNL